MGVRSLLLHAISHPILFLYQIFQWLLDRLLSPTPPPPHAELKRPKIAIIGAGLTGVSAASHCVGHGFDCHIFEAGPRQNLGGIWSKVNNTSGLQIHSIMYRFHPSITWTSGYPNRQQIVSQITQLWHRYALESKTSFNTRVEKVYKDPHGRWIINDPSHGRFDGVIAAVGTCGEPKQPSIPGSEHFKGEIHHSSRLDGESAKGKNVVIIGGGASAVEALEFAAATGAAHTTVLARSEKWIIPRNAVVDALLALNIFGSETVFSWIPEGLLRLLFYRELADLAPPRGSSEGLFTETPMVNSAVFALVRDGKAAWLRGDILGFAPSGHGLTFSHRARGVPKNGPGAQKLVDADMVILATGYTRPSLAFLPPEVFEEPYAPPNWYLQVFPPEHPSLCANNCTYINAIGTVGNYHIGIYTRFLLMYLVDPLARPRRWWMERWVDGTRWVKQRAPGGAFEFFTYSELVWWCVFTLVVVPFRWKWVVFVLFGVGEGLPLRIVEGEDKLRGGSGNSYGQRSRRTEGAVEEGVWMASGRKRGRE